MVGSNHEANNITCSNPYDFTHTYTVHGTVLAMIGHNLEEVIKLAHVVSLLLIAFADFVQNIGALSIDITCELEDCELQTARLNMQRQSNINTR